MIIIHHYGFGYRLAALGQQYLAVWINIYSVGIQICIPYHPLFSNKGMCASMFCQQVPVKETHAHTCIPLPHVTLNYSWGLVVLIKKEFSTWDILGNTRRNVLTWQTHTHTAQLLVSCREETDLHSFTSKTHMLRQELLYCIYSPHTCMSQPHTSFTSFTA